MQHSLWHPSRASGNIPTASVVLGIVGLAFNPLLSLLGFALGSLGENKRIQKRAKEFKKTYGFKIHLG